IDNLWVGKFYGETGLGLYNRAYMLMSMPVNVIRGHINTVMYPVIVNKSLTKQEIKTEMIHFIKLISAVLSFPAIVFILFPNRLSVFLWGENWNGVGEYLGILSIALLLLGFTQLSNSLYVILRKEKVWLINGIISGIVVMALISVGVMFSINAMIYGYLAALLFVSLPLTFYLGYYRSFSFSLREIVSVAGYNYVGAITFFILKLMALDALLIYPAVFVAGVSLLRVIGYVKFLNAEKNIVNE
ncbi:oligosaccharide flippase family protein, partial [Fulvivirga kasyanovii]